DSPTLLQKQIGRCVNARLAGLARSQPMQQKTAWNFALAGSNRLRELLKLYACEDVVAPVDGDAFGRRASELIKRGVSRRWAAKLEAAGIATRAMPRTTRGLPTPAPRMLPIDPKERKTKELYRGRSSTWLRHEAFSSRP